MIPFKVRLSRNRETGKLEFTKTKSSVRILFSKRIHATIRLDVVGVQYRIACRERFDFEQYTYARRSIGNRISVLNKCNITRFRVRDPT